MIHRRVLAIAVVLLATACSRSPEAFVPIAGRATCQGASGYANTPVGARTFLWRGDQLADLSNSYRKNPAAFGTLVEAANGALDHPRYSVVDKAARAPGVDRHDYTSLATYWWPSKTGAGKISYVRRDGVPNPARNGPNYDLSRLDAFSADVQLLAIAYRLTGDRRYAVKAADLVRAWFLDPATRMNPDLRFAQSIPGKSDGRGTGIIDTARFIGVVDSIGLLTTPAGLSASEVEALKHWFGRYTDWMVGSDNGKEERNAPNNHGSWFDAQLLSFALFTGREELARDVATEAAGKRIAAQIETDGTMPHELTRARTFFYSLYGTQALMDVATLAECTGVDLWHYRSWRSGGIEDSVKLLGRYAGRERTWPHPEPKIGEDQPLFHDVLARSANAYGDPVLARADATVARSITSAPVAIPINRLRALQGKGSLD